MKKNNVIVIVGVIIVLVISGVLYFKNYSNNTNEKVKATIQRVNLNVDSTMTPADKEAFEEAVAILAENQNDYASWFNVGSIKQRQEDGLLDAKIAYQNAILVDPNDIRAYFNLGNLYITLKEYDNAVTMFDKVISLNPKWINAYRENFTLWRFNLSEIYSDEAMEKLLLDGLEVSKDLSVDGNSDFYSMLGILYTMTDQKDKAISAYQTLLRIDPTNDGAKIELEKLKSN